MRKFYTQRILLLMAACLLLPSTLQAQTATVYTPRGTAVPAEIYPEFTPEQITQANQSSDAAYPMAQRIGDASRRYNCHAYAWYLSEAPGSTWYWINTPGDDAYWQDGSYIQICNESEAAKISYPAGDHSATRSGVAGKHDSKWGATPLMRHDPGFTPSIYNPSVRTFYAPTKINTSSTNVCGNVTFSVASFTGGTYSWTKSANIALNTTAGSSVVATNIGNGDGWIEVVISSPCSGATVASRIALTVGNPAPTGIGGFVDAGLWRIKASTGSIPAAGVISYNWYKNGVLHYDHGEYATIPITRGGCDRSYKIEVESINACGTSPRISRTFDVVCAQNLSLSVFPNPAAEQFVVETTDSTGQKVASSFEAKLLDKDARVKQTHSTRNGRIEMDAHALSPGLYLVEIKQGNTVQRKRISIQK